MDTLKYLKITHKHIRTCLFSLCWKGKKNGKYVEVGANHPTHMSNTFLLETVFGWRGFSIEIEKSMCEVFNGDMARQNHCYEADGTVFDY